MFWVQGDPVCVLKFGQLVSVTSRHDHFVEIQSPKTGYCHPFQMIEAVLTRHSTESKDYIRREFQVFSLPYLETTVLSINMIWSAIDSPESQLSSALRMKFIIISFSRKCICLKRTLDTRSLGFLFFWFWIKLIKTSTIGPIDLIFFFSECWDLTGSDGRNFYCQHCRTFYQQHSEICKYAPRQNRPKSRLKIQKCTCFCENPLSSADTIFTSFRAMRLIRGAKWSWDLILFEE